MNLSEVFIRRPVLAIVVSLLIFLMGMQGALTLSVREYPEVEETVITVTTAYPGASADLIQGFITTPLAKAVSSVENIDFVSSSSNQGSSSIRVHMRLGTSPDQALTEVLTKVQTVRGILPQDAEDPVVVKGTGRTMPIMFIAFWSDQMGQEQIGEYLTRAVEPGFATIPGVASTRVVGASDYAMRIWLDPVQLAAHNVTAAEVADAIRRNNFLAAPGKIESRLFAYAVQSTTTLKTPEAFGMLPLRGSGQDVVRLRDVARIELGAANYDQRVILEEGEGAFIAVFPTPGANPLAVSKGVRALYAKIKTQLPPGLHSRMNMDTSETIEASIKEVFVTMSEAVIIVILVVLLFLGSIRTVLIPTVTIPLSLIGACFILFALGYSINLLTLLAMVLAIGLVVDDAIVVVENVHRHLEMGQKPVEAAITAMREILGPIVAMTITLAAVYAPIGFVQGLTGTLFREFAYALAGAVIISGVIAVTLSPMMSARLLAHGGDNGHDARERFARRAEAALTRLARRSPRVAERLPDLRRTMVAAGDFIAEFPKHVDRSFAWLSGRYGELLRATMTKRSLIVLLSGIMLVTSAVLFMRTPKVLAPEEDEGYVMSFPQAPRYATADYTAGIVRQMDKAVGKIPELKTGFAVVGVFGPVNTGMKLWVLKPWGDRDKSQKEVREYIQGAVGKVPGAQIPVFTPISLPGAGDGFPVQYVIRSVAGADRVFEIGEKIVAKAVQTGRFFLVNNSASYDLPHAFVEIDRDRAAALGVPVSEIGSTLSVLMSEGWVSRFDQDSRSYQVIPQVLPADRFSPETMERFYVRSASGTMVPLSAVVKIRTETGPQSIEQFNQLNATTIGAVPKPGTSVQQGLEVLRQAAREVMPDGFFEDITGEARVAAQEGSSLIVSFAFAVLVIYLVLAAQFESFRDPLIIMTAVPLSIFGALVPLNIGSMFQVNGASLNIYTQLGLITLVGLIAKHGILLVQFANDRRAAGVPLDEAILEAAHVRLRPILMTTAAMVMGVVPLLFASGAGAAARFSIGLVIASGMAIGTLFTLFVVPVFYTYLSRKDEVRTEPARPTIAPAIEADTAHGPRRRAL